ncbi:ABC transporter ATP-binding protein [Robbsia andropogonis]|uniref:ABC transporter ATP-binding protein n=1 Tax=Robbsia andropogonis TaxID=28092 RepID=UPI003899C85D
MARKTAAGLASRVRRRLTGDGAQIGALAQSPLPPRLARPYDEVRMTREPMENDALNNVDHSGHGNVVRTRALSRRFGERNVIDRLDLDIADGEFVALVGRSGCGKSTLLRVLAKLDEADGGEVMVPERRAVAFQAPRLIPWLKLARNVALGDVGKGSALEHRQRVDAALEEVGLAQRRDAWPRVLSGGEAQRASLARALLRQPKLLLLDEPFGALDALTRRNAQRLVSRLWRAHRCAVLLITHDIDEALLLADRVLVMEAGRISHEVQVDLGPTEARDMTAPRFGTLRRTLLDRLGVEEKPGGGYGQAA